ncbi:IclR family transcriptional regulator [Leucobacter japonicus]|uniref:IclR family transcriptional regulator n=1 Tax=Leucobacter japonicus TaxID=1461259 RepID=UPI0006A78BAE|nr:helix-turn-helix domain-containing protein [Leucobacter japonicus]
MTEHDVAAGNAEGANEAPSGESGAGPRAVHRALELLSIVVDRGPLPLTELARASGLATSTALRSLRALEHWDYVGRGTDGSYAIGARFAKSMFSADAPTAEDLVDRSATILQRLTDDTGESSYLTVPGPAHTCLYLREVQSEQPIRHVGFSGWAGRTVRADGSAVGEVLAGATPAVGYLVMDALLAPDATVIAAPVRDNEEIVAAISIVGPSFRMGADAVTRFGPMVQSAANALTAALRPEA